MYIKIKIPSLLMDGIFIKSIPSGQAQKVFKRRNLIHFDAGHRELNPFNGI
tara:strand:- start:110168 stop:110320 length:153 start_codon:yes stop_codon:yes gene_type:complete